MSPGQGWAILALAGALPASQDLLAHARALAGPEGSVTVRLARPGSLVVDARHAMAQERFRVVLVDLEDPAVGETGAQALADVLGEGGPSLFLLCPPGDRAGGV